MIWVISNPTAGTGCGRTIGEKVDKELTDRGIEHVIYFPDSSEQATQIARNAAEQHAEKVLSVGGDGTLLQVAEGLCNSKTALGIIPAGTGNDFIKTIKTPSAPMEALDFALANGAKPTDIVRLNDRMFLNEIGTGFDVSVLEYAEKVKHLVRGLLPYLWGVICTIFHFKPTQVTFSLDGGEESTRDLLVFGAGNGRYIGGGIPIAPEAVVDDGKLDIILVSKMKTLRMCRVLLPLLQGKILTFPETEKLVASKVRLKGKNLKINIDGEIVPMDQLEIEVLPGAIQVIRP